MVLYHNAYNKKSQLINANNLQFLSSFSIATAGFGLDYNNVKDDNLKLYTFNQCISKLSISSSVYQLTDYYHVNIELDLILHDLSSLMIDPTYKDNILQNHNEIFVYLEKIKNNLKYMDSTKKLSALILKIKNDSRL